MPGGRPSRQDKACKATHRLLQAFRKCPFFGRAPFFWGVSKDAKRKPTFFVGGFPEKDPPLPLGRSLGHCPSSLCGLSARACGRPQRLHRGRSRGRGAPPASWRWRAAAARWTPATMCRSLLSTEAAELELELCPAWQQCCRGLLPRTFARKWFLFNANRPRLA